MKNRMLSKLSCAVAIGLFMPLGVANAASFDSGRPASIALETYPELAPTAEGAQGPVRTDMTADTAATFDSGRPASIGLETYPELAPVAESAQGQMRTETTADQASSINRRNATLHLETYPE
jgi:hypothetical protein